MSDLVERMARASYEAEVNRWPQYKNGFQEWEKLGPETKERFRFAARAAMAIVLEEAAKVADKRATELSILRDGAPHVSANGHPSWSDYNSCCVEIRSLAIELCKLALEGKHD
jgi:hypothetical protein